MNKFYFNLIALLFITVTTSLAQASSQFSGKNFSGEYVCKGKNESVGDYEVYVTLKLKPLSSHGNFGVYDLNTETTNKVIYFGQAIVNGYHLAMTFKLSNSKNIEYSTGIGEFKKISTSLWAFSNRYYDPNNQGGGVGNEYCTMKPSKNIAENAE